MTPVHMIEAQLRAMLEAACFRPSAPSYFEEPRGRYEGSGGLVVAPSSVEDVSRIMALCFEHRVAVVPYGGGTGLVGGQVMEGALSNPLILSLERMAQIRDIDPISNVATVEAGVVLETLKNAADEAGRLFPLSIAAKGSARIGGNLATNAGGTNVLRYGNARELCLGLEVVMPDGSILSELSGLHKDNTGYDLKGLMIGSEGTLGIITAAALKLFPKPTSEAAALFTVENPQAALDILSLAREQVGEGVSAFELMSGDGLAFFDEVGLDLRLPFDELPAWSVLIDFGLTGLDTAQPALEHLFASASQAGLTLDGVISQSQAQRSEFWSIRENLPEANRRIGSISSHDISVPLRAIPEFIKLAPQALAALGSFRVNCFGHVGDGNLHWNVFPPKGKTRSDFEHQRADIKRAVHDLVHTFGGSVAAEHGVGRLKVEDLETYAEPARLQAMRAIKNALDAKGIMNPGAVLRAPEL